MLHQKHYKRTSYLSPSILWISPLLLPRSLSVLSLQSLSVPSSHLVFLSPCLNLQPFLYFLPSDLPLSHHRPADNLISLSLYPNTLQNNQPPNPLVPFLFFKCTFRCTLDQVCINILSSRNLVTSVFLSNLNKQS